MARKRYVRCYECGMEFNRKSFWNLEAGYNKKSRRYLCPICNRKLHGKKPSPTIYKVCGIIAMTFSAIVILMGLLLTTEMLGAGIGFAIFGVVFFLLGKKYWNMSKIK